MSWEPGRERREPGYSALSSGSLCPGQLKSNSSRLMDEAVLALRNLARQCSDSSAMEALARHLFAILGGGLAFPDTGVAEVWSLVLPGCRGLMGARCSEFSCVSSVNGSTGRVVWVGVISSIPYRCFCAHRLSIGVFVHIG